MVKKKCLILFSILFLFLLSGAFVYSNPGTSTKWVQNSTIVSGLDLNNIGSYAAPDVAYNITGDLNWTLIVGRGNGTWAGYYWDNTSAQWVENSSYITGLADSGDKATSTMKYNVTGDGNWTLIAGYYATPGSHSLKGYYWNGSEWVADSTRVAGLPTFDRGGNSELCFNCTGDGNWSLFVIEIYAGAKTGYYWDGSEWVAKTSYVEGFGGAGYGKPEIAFNITGDGNWTEVAGRYDSSIYCKYWNGTEWLDYSTLCEGITATSYQKFEFSNGTTGSEQWIAIQGKSDGNFTGYNWIEDTTNPYVTLTSPADNSKNTTQAITFYFVPKDDIDLKNATIYTNFSGTWSQNESNSSAISNNTDESIAVQFDDNKTFIWNVRVCDNADNCNFATANFTLTTDTDISTPNVSLVAPSDISYNNTDDINFIFNVTDESNVINCTLWTNISGTWEFNETNTSVITNNSLNTITLNDIDDGSYIWNVNCTDNAGNHAFNNSGNFTVTVDTVPPSINWNKTYLWNNKSLTPDYANNFTVILNLTELNNISWANLSLISPNGTLIDNVAGTKYLENGHHLINSTTFNTDQVGNYSIRINISDMARHFVNSTWNFTITDVVTPSPSGEISQSKKTGEEYEFPFSISTDTSRFFNFSLLCVSLDASHDLCGADFTWGYQDYSWLNVSSSAANSTKIDINVSATATEDWYIGNLTTTRVFDGNKSVAANLTINMSVVTSRADVTCVIPSGVGKDVFSMTTSGTEVTDMNVSNVNGEYNTTSINCTSSHSGFSFNDTAFNLEINTSKNLTITITNPTSGNYDATITCEGIDDVVGNTVSGSDTITMAVSAPGVAAAAPGGGGPGVKCDFDGWCESGETPTTCSDCLAAVNITPVDLVMYVMPGRDMIKEVKISNMREYDIIINRMWFVASEVDEETWKYARFKIGPNFYEELEDQELLAKSPINPGYSFIQIALLGLPMNHTFQYGNETAEFYIATSSQGVTQAFHIKVIESVFPEIPWEWLIIIGGIIFIVVVGWIVRPRPKKRKFYRYVR